MNKIHVLVSLITDDNDFQLEQAASAQAVAAQLGASVQVIYSGNDAVQQTQQILTFIQDPAKRPDAILVEPVGTAMPQVAKAAVSSGIAWCLLNSDADYIPQLRQHALVPVFSVVSDHEQIGKIQGQQIGAILGDQGCILHVEGPSVRDVAKIRTRGMLATKPRGIDVKTIRGDWTQRSGHQAVKSWLALSTSRQLNVGMVACQNDDMAAGARRAFEEIGDPQDRESWLRRPIIGCDGVLRSGQTWVRQGRLAATVISPPQVADAMHLLTTALNTGAQPPERTLLAPSSFPSLAELQKNRAKAAHGLG
jgi:ribose transport system substrate-binding protein